MVVTVVVTGVPQFMSLKDLAVEFNEVFVGEDLGDFRIRDIKLTSSKRHVALDFESGFDAMTVQEKLDGFKLETPESTNVIKAKIQNSSEEPQPGNVVVISTTFRQDYYKPAVEYQNESLDVEIELLKKKTLAVKSRRKLIKEQKKLKKEFRTLNVDSDDESPRSSKSSKRKRIRTVSDSSGSTGYYAVKYEESKKIRELKSPEPGPSLRRFGRSKSTEKHKSPSRFSETHKRRSRSREKYYSHKSIDYKKDLSHRTESQRSRSQHESDHSKVRPKSSKQHRSPSPYKNERSGIDSRKRKSPRSRSRSDSPFTRKLVKTDDSKYRNRYPSTEKTLYEKSRKSELDDQRKTAKGIERKPSRHEELAEINAAMQSRKRQAMEDILFEMELSLKREQDTVTNSYKTFLTSLMKGIVQGRFQKLEVHEKLMVSDIVSLYRSQYSKEDDRTLLRNLASECKSLDEISNTFVAASTVEVPQQSQQTQNDEIWSAVDEALDGVDIDSLQVETDTNEVQAKVNIKKEPKITEELNEKANSTEADANEMNFTAIKSRKKEIKSTKDDFVVKANSTDTNIPNDIIEVTETNSESAIDLTDDIKVHDAKPDDNDVEEVQELVKIESIELSDESDTELENARQVNVTSTLKEGHVAINNIDWTDQITDVISLGNTEAKQTTISIKKENVATVDLTDDIEDKQLNNDHTNNDLSATHSLRAIKKENISTDVIDSITDPSTDIVSVQPNVEFPQTSLLTRIKEENIEVDLTSLTDDDDDEIVTSNNESNPTTLDSNLVPCIKVEREHPDTDLNRDKCVKQSETVFSNTITVKQEPESTVADSINLSNKPEINNLNPSLDKNISISIKKENVTSEANQSNGDEKSVTNQETVIPKTTISTCIKDENKAIEGFTSQREKSEMNKDVTVPETSISSCIKIENMTIEAATSQSEMNQINNDQITELTNPAYKKQEDVATDNSASASQSEPINVKQEPTAMPVSTIISVKQECNNMETVNSDPIDQSDATDIRCIQPIKKETESAADKLNDTKTRAHKTVINSDEPNQTPDKTSAQQDTEDLEDGDIVEEGEIIDEPDSPVHHNQHKNVKIKQENKSDGSKKDNKDKDKSKKRKRSSLEEQIEDKHSFKKIKEEKDGSIKYYREERESSRYREDRYSTIRHREEKGSSVRYREEKESSRFRKESHSYTKHKELIGEWYISNKPVNFKDDKIIEQDIQEQNFIISDKVPPANPLFVLPTFIIMRGMKAVIKNKFNEHKYIYNITQKVLQARFRELLKDKACYVKAKGIAKMYKEHYAKENYTDFLNGVVADIKAGKYDDEIKIMATRHNKVEKKGQSISEVEEQSTLAEKETCTSEQKEQCTSKQREQSTTEQKEQSTVKLREPSTPKQIENSTSKLKAQFTEEKKEQSTTEQNEQSTVKMKEQSTPKQKKRSTSDKKDQSTSKLKEKSTSEKKDKSTSKQKVQSTSKVKEKSTPKHEEQSTSEAKEQFSSKVKEQSTSKVKEQPTSDQREQLLEKEQSPPEEKEQTTSKEYLPGMPTA